MNHLLDFHPIKKLLALSVMLLLMFGTILVAAPVSAETITADVIASNYWSFYRGDPINQNQRLATNYELKTTDETYYDVFCFQPDENAQMYAGKYTILDFEDYYPVINDNSGLLSAAWIANEFFDGRLGDINTTNKSRAQAAIWEMLYVTSNDDIRSGDFYLYDTETNLSAIQNIINAALVAGSDNSAPLQNTDFSGMKIAQLDGQQDFAFYREMPTQNPAPEPATMLLFGVGLIGLAGVVRKTV